MKNGNMKRRSGFTLVELLVVIGIIGLLVGILLPSLRRARLAAQAVQCQSNLRQFGLGIQMYCDANKGFMPQKGPDGSNTGTNFFGPSGGVAGYDDPSLWFNAIPKMLKGKTYYEMILQDFQNPGKGLPLPGDNNIFMCPSAGQCGTIGVNDVLTSDSNYFVLNGTDSTGVVTSTPANTFKFNLSYVYNSKFTDTIAVPTGPTKLSMTKLRPSALVVTMVEKMANPQEYQDTTVQAYNTQYPTVYAGKITAAGLNNKIGQPKSNWKRYTTRHNHGGHLLFADGHVAFYTWVAAQIQPDQLPGNALTATSDANQYNTMIWSVLGPIQ